MGARLTCWFSNVQTLRKEWPSRMGGPAAKLTGGAGVRYTCEQAVAGCRAVRAA